MEKDVSLSSTPDASRANAVSSLLDYSMLQITSSIVTVRCPLVLILDALCSRLHKRMNRRVAQV